MDNLSEPEVIVNPHSSPKIPIIISGVILLLVIIIFLGLKYFNLPKTTTKPTPKPILSTNKTTPKITLSCPVPKEFCSKGEEVVMGDAFAGLGFNLPQDTKLVAVFDGKVDDQPKVKGRASSQPLLYLRNDKGQEVIYSYYGTVTVKIGSQVTAGQQLGVIGKGNFPVSPLSSYNLLFTFQDNSKFQKLTPQSFTK